MSQAAEIVAVCVGPGGIPKPQVETCAVTVEGLEGDGHRYESHGGPDRAVCLLALEVYEALREDGVACDEPGTFGEKRPDPWPRRSELEAGDRLRFGEGPVV